VTAQRALAASAAAAVGLLGLQARALAEDDPEGVQLRIQSRDPLQIQINQLARRNLAGGDQPGLAGHASEG